MLLRKHEERNVVYSTEQSEKEREQADLHSVTATETFNTMCEQEETLLKAIETGNY